MTSFRPFASTQINLPSDDAPPPDARAQSVIRVSVLLVGLVLALTITGVVALLSLPIPALARAGLIALLLSGATVELYRLHARAWLSIAVGDREVWLKRGTGQPWQKVAVRARFASAFFLSFHFTVSAERGARSGLSLFRGQVEEPVFRRLSALARAN